jgi:hypothetical protein
MNNSGLTQYYVLESYSRAEAIKGQCKHLLTSEYASDAPKNLAKTIINLCEFFQRVGALIYKDLEEDLEGAIFKDVENILRPLKILDKWITHVGEHVKYIDSARSQRVPWSIIPAFEDFADNLIGDVEVMFCPLWEYNYQFISSDIKKHYQYIIRSLMNVPGVPGDSEETVLDNLKKPFHIIRFPSPERLNIRLHANIGHELGHKFAAIFFSDERKDRFTKSILIKVKELVEEGVKEKKIPAEPLIKLNYNRQYLERAAHVWERALEEILSDITAGILFGPAALFSIFDFALKDELDHLPSEKINFYPPWRLRLRTAVSLLVSPGNEFFPIPKEFLAKNDPFKKGQAALEYFDFIKSITEPDNNAHIISQDPLVKLVYENLQDWIDEGVQFLLDEQKLGERRLTPKKLFEKLPHLLDRLENSIIPNALEMSVDNRSPADFAEIVNVAWFYWLSQPEAVVSNNGLVNREAYKLRVKMNNLCLKAVEYAHLEYCYRNACDKP